MFQSIGLDTNAKTSGKVSLKKYNNNIKQLERNLLKAGIVAITSMQLYSVA